MEKSYPNNPVVADFLDNFGLVVENMSDGLSILDENGCFIFNNKVCEQLIGKVDQLHFKEVLNPKYHAEAQKNFDAVIQGGEGHFRYELLSDVPDRKPIVIDVNAKSLRKNGKTIGVVGISRMASVAEACLAFISESRSEIEKQMALRTDELVKINKKLKSEIDEHKRTEHTLRANEERYRAFFENNPIETIIVDSEGRVTGYNLSSKWAGKRSPNIGDRMYADYAANHAIDMHKELMECIRTGEPKEFPEQMYFDKYLNIRLSPFSDGAIITSIDITYLKRVEEERAHLATAIDQAGVGIVMLDTDGIIEYVNTAFENNTGYSQNEVIGKSLMMIEDLKDEEKFSREIRHTLAQGQIWSGRHTSQKKDGTFYDVESTFSPVKDDAGKIRRIMAVRRDVTREMQLEQMLLHSQKMEAIGTLAGGIAHDFNNILGSIVLNTELALDDIPETGETAYSLEQVLKASHRAKDLVEQILTFSRDSEVEKKSLQISVILKETLKMLRAMFPATIDIRRNIDPDAGTVLANPTQIQQLVMNLCNNAVHAMADKGGLLEVKLQMVAENDLPVRLGLLPGSYVKLSIRDTGQGISPEDKKRIFDPFFTTKQTGEGTGLGLSVVHGIVANHGGRINVKSKVGKGSTFEVYLPKIDDIATAKKEDDRPLPTGEGTILLVDDEEVLLDANKRILERLGYSVKVVTSGAKALKLFRKKPEQFDLVMTDMTMPNMTGAELSKQLIEIRSDIPIILCTGYHEAITPEKARAIGIREYFMKPFVIREIAEVIQKLVMHKK